MCDVAGVPWGFVAAGGSALVAALVVAARLVPRRDARAAGR
ncbi:MAG: hypothetical protein NTW05_16890 [Pseudonocardiales bacterium]|nr:hypothetical protein [Pseudonocardiales bacterium]